VEVGDLAAGSVGRSSWFDFSLETADSRATDATYLDVPDPDGARLPVHFEDCIAE
jgi:hypothetical protein